MGFRSVFTVECWLFPLALNGVKLHPVHGRHQLQGKSLQKVPIHLSEIHSRFGFREGSAVQMMPTGGKGASPFVTMVGDESQSWLIFLTVFFLKEVTILHGFILLNYVSGEGLQPLAAPSCLRHWKTEKKLAYIILYCMMDFINNTPRPNKPST